MKKFYIETHGCQMNVDDSTRMGQLLKTLHYEPTTESKEADLVLINTCSVREKASHRAHSAVGRFHSLKKIRPWMILGISGCQAQSEGESLLSRFDYLDFVLGPDQLSKLPEIVCSLEGKAAVSINATSRIKPQDFSFVDLTQGTEESKTQAFVTIMKGCDNFCSFCIVPYVRGREVSRSSNEIIREISRLCEHGVKEVTLLGQNVNSYGTQKQGEISFARLLYRIAEETPLQRLRFTTSHPKDVKQDLIQAFCDLPILAKHLHLPVQSGSNSVLKKMYRTYTREEYLEVVRALKKACPEIALTTDLIVGFPGETSADFDETLSLFDEVQFDAAYSFHYSPRPHTTAGRYLADDVPGQEKESRLRLLQEKQHQISLLKNQECVGKSYEILLEGPSKIGVSFQGRTTHNRVVHVSGGEASKVGEFLTARIVRATPSALIGEI